VFLSKSAFIFVFAAVLLGTMLSLNASAQSIGLGAEIGAPLTDSFTGNSFSNSLITSVAKRYTVGPSFEWMGNEHFGFETAALYKHSGYKQDLIVAGSQTNMNSWEFPFLGKATIPGQMIGVFADGGLALRYLRGSTTYSALGTPLVNQPLSFSDPWSRGIVAGGGVSMKVGRLYLEPKLRYTRWILGNSSVPAFISNPNQIEYLLGVRFKN
jgi:hypothetical protein